MIPSNSVAVLTSVQDTIRSRSDLQKADRISAFAVVPILVVDNVD